MICINGSTNIKLTGFDFYGCNRWQVYTLNSNKVTIDNCNFYRAHIAAIGGYNNFNYLVQGNNIYNSSDNGILSVFDNNATYSDNTILSSGLEDGYGGDRNGWHLS